MSERRDDDERWTGAKWRALAGAVEPGGDDTLVPAAMLTRRTFLGLLGAGLALAGCEGGVPEKVLPYGVTPPELTPGVPQHYATSMVLDGYATGLIVESHEGRPTKVEGNPDHPASLGAAGPFEQASVWQLYDPHRATGLQHQGHAVSWDRLRQRLGPLRADGGAGLRIVLPPSSSPTVASLLGRILERSPRARVTFHAPAASAPERGAQLAFGRPLLPQLDLSRADVVVSLDADPLAQGTPFWLRYARQWSTRRSPSDRAQPMLRWYQAEPMLSVTGSVADERLRVTLGELPQVALALVDALTRLRPDLKRALPASPGDPQLASARGNAWVQAAARDLANAGANAVVLASRRAPEAVQALAHALDRALGSTAAWTIAPVQLALGQSQQDLPSLVDEMRAGTVDTLVLLGVNPVYDAPAELDFAGALTKVRDSVTHALYQNETAAKTGWFVPALHFLESWGDARAYDGTESIVQPLMRPRFSAHGELELLALVAGEANADEHQLVRERFERDHPGRWAQTLQRGLVDGSAAPPVNAPVDVAAVSAALRALPNPSSQPLELCFHPDYSVYDGRFADVAWLQELPRPLTSLTWDNAALISPAEAKRLGVGDGDRVELAAGGRTVVAPILVAPGHADGCVSVALGYGRSGGETLVNGVGFDAYPLRTRAAPWRTGVSVRKLDGARHPLARTQLHHDLDGRPIALSTTLDRYRRHPDQLTDEHKGPLPTLLPNQLDGGVQWAMSIDLGRCTGCSACVVACQSENNVPVVGKQSVLHRREMHWLRIDTYFSGTAESPGVVHQPMLCQHCEKAPCEYVCPVNATVHSPDGLNEMIYNRCVGTRFCSNNCPYKVRRFNWFNWEAKVEANQGSVDLQRNPDVTVRDRGVMEKCTYCVQRLREAAITADGEKRPIRPGEVQVACQQACPTRAIEFGSLSHEDTPMMQYRREPRSYAVLHDQGTRPRTMYLARIDNPTRSR